MSIIIFLIAFVIYFSYYRVSINEYLLYLIYQKAAIFAKHMLADHISIQYLSEYKCYIAFMQPLLELIKRLFL